MAMQWEWFFVHNVAPLFLQQPLTQPFPAALAGGMGQCSVYLSRCLCYPFFPIDN